MYTCGPTKSNYVQTLGYEYSSQFQYWYALTNFTVNPDYACTMFISCEKTSFIAESDVTSSLQFLDFLGYNGKDEGKSIIYFAFSDDDAISLNQVVYDCSYDVPSNGTLEGYTDVLNCTCAYCQASCEPPNVNGEVGFFDGCNGELVAIVWGLLVLFSVILFVFREYCQKKQDEEEKKSHDDSQKIRPVNKTTYNKKELINESNNLSNNLSRTVEGQRNQ